MRLALLLLACNSALPPGKPTYRHDIAPLVAAHCQECHLAGGITPAAPHLDDYESARSYSQPIQVATQVRRMPPWLADNSGACGTWQDARWLSENDIATIAVWQKDGAPEGVLDVITMATHSPPAFRGDVALDIGGVYKPGVGAGGNRCFVTDPKLDRDRLLTAIQVVSTDPRAVAQVTLFALDSDAAETAVNSLDALDPGLGYPCFGTTRGPDARLVASWTWPSPILRMPAGTGVRLSAGRRVVVQIHYNVAYTGSGFASDTQVVLELDDRVTEARVVPVSAAGPLAPGLESVTVESTQPAAQRMRVVGVAPRMHIRGNLMKLTAGPACLGLFDNWNVFAQQLFRAVDPVVVEAGDPLHLTCTYGTLGRTAPVQFGDAIDDEECLAWLFVTD